MKKSSSTVSGCGELLRDLQKLGDSMKDVQKDMLKAGGEEMAQAWREEIQARGFERSGSMLKGVRAIVKLGSAKKSMRAEVTSHGTDEHGASNSAKAFYLHYGTSRGIHASHWIDAAENIGYPRALSAMRRILDQALNNTIGAKR